MCCRGLPPHSSRSAGAPAVGFKVEASGFGVYGLNVGVPANWFHVRAASKLGFWGAGIEDLLGFWGAGIKDLL